MTFFEIFDLLILGSGLFPVFTGMAGGSQSGKLKFRRIVNGDSTITLLDGPNGITVSSNIVASPAARPLGQIVYGTGAGITSNLFCVDTRTNYSAITGAAIFSSYCSEVADASKSNLIVSGCFNYILSYGHSNTMIGGYKSCIDCGSKGGGVNTCVSTILTSKYSKSLSNDSTIVGTRYSCLGKYTHNSTIISGVRNEIKSTVTNGNCSIIIGGVCNLLNTAYGSYNNLIFSSKCSSIGSYYFDGSKVTLCYSTNIKNSGIVSGGRNYIGNTNGSSGCTSNSLILSGIYNCIKGGLISPYETYGSQNSLMISGCCNKISDANNSSILGGSYNCIYINRTSSDTSPESNNSTIIGGNCLVIRAYTAGAKSTGSSIISSPKASITNSVYSSIISVDVSPAPPSIYASSRSVLVGGSGNCMDSSTGTTIMSGKSNYISYTCYSSIVNGCSNSIFGSQNSAIMSSCDSVIRGDVCSSSIIGSKGSIICEYNSSIICNSSIVGGCGKMCIGSSGNKIEDSIIVNGVGTELIGFHSSNALISGKNNKITSTSGGGTNNSVIIGGSYQYICGNTCNSVLASGSFNSIGDAASNSAIIGGFCNCICQSKTNSVIIGGCCLCLNYANTLMIPNFRFRYSAYPTCGGQFGRNGTFSVSTQGTFIIRNGFVTTT